MRSILAITVGVAASALLVAACDAPPATAPSEPPSLARLRSAATYDVTFRCSPNATHTTFAVLFFNHGEFVSQLNGFCFTPTSIEETGFDSFTFDIKTTNDAGQIVRECVGRHIPVGLTGKFPCDWGRLSAVLGVQPQRAI
jgi:hypothetical protein